MDDDLTLEQVAVVMAVTVQVLARFAEMEVEDLPPARAIPKDALCIGEALMLVPAAMVLAAKLYPELLDPATLAGLLRGTRIHGPLLN